MTTESDKIDGKITGSNILMLFMMCSPEARTNALHHVSKVICLECGRGSFEQPNPDCKCKADW